LATHANGHHDEAKTVVYCEVVKGIFDEDTCEEECDTSNRHHKSEGNSSLSDEVVMEDRVKAVLYEELTEGVAEDIPEGVLALAFICIGFIKGLIIIKCLWR